jgi:Xaa-Pro aminopeptidase
VNQSAGPEPSSDRQANDAGGPEPAPPAMADRLARCRALLAGEGLDAALITSQADVRYLSGFRGDDTTLIIGRAAALICTDSRYWAQVREEVAGFDLVEAVGGDLVGDSATAVAERLGPDAVLGFQGTDLSYAGHRKLRRRHRGRLRDLGARIGRLRLVKDAHEVACMRRAARVTDEAVGVVTAQGLVGRTEADVAWALRVEYHRLGAEGEAFPAIVAAGDHAAHAHAVPGGRVIAAGELVVIDTGARVDGYCSDLTRTVAAGEPSPELRRLYEIVLEAQLAGVAAVRAGAHGRDDVDAACRRVITAAGHGADFGHGTGHGVGLEIHEGPGLGRVKGDTLQAGMVCTVEPGIYVEGVAGIRIEDTVLVTEGGCERLTTLPRDLLVAG